MNAERTLSSSITLVRCSYTDFVWIPGSVAIILLRFSVLTFSGTSNSQKVSGRHFFQDRLTADVTAQPLLTHTKTAQPPVVERLHSLTDFTGCAEAS
jgi:hypothetical protein